jgi:hypothetical protein
MGQMIASQLPAELRRQNFEFANISGPEFARISNNIDEMIAESRGPQALSSRAARDAMFSGNAALEQGTAAAFSQSHRSSQGLSGLVDVSKKQLDENKQQTKALLRIDANLRATQQVATVDLGGVA